MEEGDRMGEGLVAQGPRALRNESATVPGSNPDAEGSVIGQQRWQAIYERRAAGQGLSAIARELDVCRHAAGCILSLRDWGGYGAAIWMRGRIQGRVDHTMAGGTPATSDAKGALGVLPGWKVCRPFQAPRDQPFALECPGQGGQA